MFKGLKKAVKGGISTVSEQGDIVNRIFLHSKDYIGKIILKSTRIDKSHKYFNILHIRF